MDLPTPTSPGQAPLRVGGKLVGPPAKTDAGPGNAGAAATGAPLPRTPRSLPLPGGGYDRVGGSRLTGTGAVLLAVVIFVIASPPAAADHELVTVLWASLLAILVIGIVAPMVLVRRVTVAASSTRDATVGQSVDLTVDLHGPSGGVEIRALDPTGPWQRTAAPGRGTVAHLADRRGLFHAVRVEVRITAPLGVLAAHRVHLLPLPFAVEVAPRSLPVTWLPAPAPVADSAVERSLAAATGDLVRSVRPYVAGDAPHLVHWPSSARIGDLVVRELEEPAPLGQAIVLDLRDLGVDTERAASFASGAAHAVLAAGGHLMLVTCEAHGPVAAEVRSLLDVGRRLARAVPGQPPEVPPGWPVVEIGR